MTVLVLDPGILSTLQDLGRSGHASLGIPPSGAADAFAHRAANLLASNDPGAAAIEMTLRGASLRFDEPGVASIAGAAFEVSLDRDPVPIGRSFEVRAGQTLHVGQTRRGMRAYLAVHGGFDPPAVLGSRSTHVAAGIGGIGGRALASGDTLRIGKGRPTPVARRLLAGALQPSEMDESELRVVMGPQADRFTARSVRAFLSEIFTVSPRSDRVGTRLRGPAMEHVGGADVDPEGTIPGCVQVPGDGHPIVLGPDGPTTGGYAKIATVITADLSVLAQRRPGASIRFRAVDVKEARRALRERHHALACGVVDG